MSQRHGARDWARARRQMTPTGNLKLIALISATVATWQQGHGASTVGRGQVRPGRDHNPNEFLGRTVEPSCTLLP